MLPTTWLKIIWRLCQRQNVEKRLASFIFTLASNWYALVSLGASWCASPLCYWSSFETSSTPTSKSFTWWVSRSRSQKGAGTSRSSGPYFPRTSISYQSTSFSARRYIRTTRSSSKFSRASTSGSSKTVISSILLSFQHNNNLIGLPWMLSQNAKALR